MPLTIYRKFGIGKIKPNTVTLQMTDRSVKFLIGVLEDAPVKVGHLYFPTDFIIMEIREDPHVPTIMDMKPLCTAGIIIDVKRGKLSMNV